ncbi:DUF928 domain-containing protein [Leptolyngbya sp. FACHB-261]|uniref:DUF928 domain-containing protein n=1 Tax=Leptolyngbya sp. FACHB-261 TaxID=2692806 RepID=UPI001685FA74|nr:DUF928 domain-containing protein [Leptolyngbya sp. FACHB-261]MBD2100198.1 DUF928 domain-containing protein [Leptolyngbya sp. FACHB-261]
MFNTLIASLNLVLMASSPTLLPRGTELASEKQSWQVAQTYYPPDRGAPPSTSGGATRSSCVSGDKPLTALVAADRPGLTTLARPSFFLYVPSTQAQTAEFVLKDDSGDEVYRTILSLPSQPGVMSFSLPANSPSLEVNKDYRWYFSLICQPENRLEDVFVSAWVRRVVPSPAWLGELRQAAPKERSDRYAQAGFWSDALAILAELRRTSPQDSSLAAAWNRLLQAANLGILTDAPLLSGPR